jgi:hypothetical protein
VNKTRACLLVGGPRATRLPRSRIHGSLHVQNPKSKHAPASAIKPKKKLSAASVVGAPAQHNQASRKGKRAWRKNVDIEDLEEKLEGLREEERTFGCGFYRHKLFVQA